MMDNDNGPHNDIKAPKGGQNSKPTLSPSRIIPDESEWRSPTTQNWGQPYYARATFMKLCLPALLYSLVLNASQKVLSLVPFASRLHIGVEKLHPESGFMPHLSTLGEESNRPVAIVTGSNTGVGYKTAKGLAERGYHVILACRSREKGEAAAKKINLRLGTQEGGDPRCRGGKASFLHPLDLSSFASVRSFSEVFRGKYKSLNVLVNNAGINSEGDVTEDGLEICFQSNFVGHFLLTKLLLDRLLKANNKYQTGSGNKEEAGRIVNLSSVTHHFAPANDRTLHSANSSKDLPLDNKIHDQHFWLGCAMPGLSMGTYRESKLASILFSMELNKRHGGKGIRSIAVNPGSVSSDIWRNDSALMQKVYKLVYLTPRQGSSTSVAGAICAFPKDAVYLQPYWQPELKSLKQQFSKSPNPVSFWRKYSVPFPMTEMLGTYVGYAITEPRLPLDGSGGYKSSEALWKVCEKITSVVG